MHNSTLTTALAGLALAGAVTTLAPRVARDFQPLDPAAIAAEPSPVWDVLYARPFRLEGAIPAVAWPITGREFSKLLSVTKSTQSRTQRRPRAMSRGILAF